MTGRVITSHQVEGWTDFPIVDWTQEAFGVPVRLGNDCDVAALAADARQRLAQLVAAFDDAATPYRAVRRARFTYDFDDYAQLARIAEWSAEGGEPGGEG